MKLLFGVDEGVCKWVSRQLFDTDSYFKNCAAIGIVEDDKFLCGVVYSNFLTRPDGDPFSIEASIASVDKRWAQKHTLRTIFAYPFLQLGVERLQCTMSVEDTDVIEFNKRLGFTIEGIARQAYPSGGDAVVSSMLKHECKWIKHGKKHSIAA